jgi:hypothetical protein
MRKLIKFQYNFLKQVLEKDLKFKDLDINCITKLF